MILDTNYLESRFSEDAQSLLNPVLEGDDLTSGAIDDANQTHDNSSSEEEYAEKMLDKDEGALGIAKMGVDGVRKSITRATRKQRLAGRPASYWTRKEETAEDLPTSSMENSDDHSTTNKSNSSNDSTIMKTESSTVKHIFSTNDDSYLYSEAYEQYIESCIDNEFIIKDYIYNKMNEGAVSVFNEAEQLQDVVAKKWDGFAQFIDGILDRFWKSMDTLVNSKKQYLEKYKDIILDKPPKENLEVTYTGDYKRGMELCKTESLPPFNYEAHADALRADGYEAAIKTFMAGKDFRYKEGDDIAKDFKAYFIGVTDFDNPGQTTISLANKEFSMKVLYDWCYNYQDLAAVARRDRANLGQSRNAIINSIRKIKQENGEDPNKNANPTTNPTQNSAGTASSKPADTTSTANGAKIDQSAYIDSSSAWIALSEVGENNTNTNNDQNKDSTPTTTGMEIKDTSSEENSDNGSKDNAETKTKHKTVDQDINNITKKWIDISRAFCTGKLTAIQQISKDYMSIIVAHVKSYDGEGTKEAENAQKDKANNPTATPPVEQPAQQNNNQK